MFTKDLIEIQPTLKSLFENIDSNRVSHAQLFSHREGGLALAYALAYITYLLCDDKRQMESCGACKHCKAMNNLTHPDVQFVYPVAKNENTPLGVSEEYLPLFRKQITENPYMSASTWNNLSEFGGKPTLIPVKQYEAINKFLSLKSFYNSYKVVLIWCPEQLNISAANKLLKHIEEPEPKTLFLLVSENVHEIISTIISRTQRTHFPLAKSSSIAHYLMVERQIQDPIEANKITENSLGNIDLAIKKAENSSFLKEIEEEFIAFAKSTYGGKNTFDMLELSRICESIDKKGKTHQLHFYKYILDVMHEIVKLQSGIKDLSTLVDVREFDLSKYSKIFDAESIDKINIEVEKAIQLLESNINSKFVIINLTIKYHYLSRYKNIPEFYIES